MKPNNVHFTPRGSMSGHARSFALLVAATFAAACATHAPKRPDIWFPDPPEKPRVKWVRTIVGQWDLEEEISFWTRVRRFLFVTTSMTVRYPTGVAIDPSERFVYVAGPTRVVRIDLKESRIDLATKVKPGAPYGVAVDGDGALYVSDKPGSVVWHFDKDGTPLGQFGRGVLKLPTGVAVDRRAQLLYVVSGSESHSTHHVIEVFSLKGEHLRTIGTRGSNSGEFNFPTNIAVTADGRILVADMLNFRVQLLDREGQPLGTFGDPGIGVPGTFEKVKGVAVDTFGNIHVSDSQNGLLQIFNERFRPLMAYGGPAIPVTVPGAIAIDSKNNIFVTDYANHSVHQFQLLNTTAEDCREAAAEGSRNPAAAAPAPAPTPAPTAAPAGPSPEGTPAAAPASPASTAPVAGPPSAPTPAASTVPAASTAPANPSAPAAK